tara:strand:+ start:7694 stop:7981 length:288 start_codon:yes stop_codon:yes gene_type:complete
MSRFTPETQAKADVFTAFLSSLDIEWSYQSTYFDDEVCVHWNGNNEPALIMSPIQFINWATYWFTPTKQNLYAKFESLGIDKDDQDENWFLASYV